MLIKTIIDSVHNFNFQLPQMIIIYITPITCAVDSVHNDTVERFNHVINSNIIEFINIIYAKMPKMTLITKPNTQ
jgi:hypothetical protein